jgi:hypothetical protein
MNASLVAFYGNTPKPDNLVKLAMEIQKILAKNPRLEFTRYEPKQVHATIVGLEGLRVDGKIVSANFAELRRTVRLLHLQEVAKHLLSSKHLPFAVRIGGFNGALDYAFASRGLHPRNRSFSIQGRIAVAMGWPARGGLFPPTLDLLRRDLARFGALHKYHTSEGEVDNDFFFVLGQFEHRLEGVIKEETEEEVRNYLSVQKPTDVDCTSDTLSFVAYQETTLNPKLTRQFKVHDISDDPKDLIDLYDPAG